MTTTEERVIPEMLPFVRPLLPRYDVLQEDFGEIVRSGMLTKGAHLERFEEAIAQHLQVRNAVAVSSCTAGLMLIYKALGLEGEVVVPSFTFMATVSALVWAGLTPVFADVDFDSTNLDPSAAERAVTERTSAIVATHNFGNPANIPALEELASRRGLALIFDAAHGFGALFQGKQLGSQGSAQSFSLSPTKLLIAAEGGIVTTNDDRLAEVIRMGREYGNDGNYDSKFAGMNARMPEFNAVLGLRSLEQLEKAATQRNYIASLFREHLGTLPGVGFQHVVRDNRSSYKDFSITIDSSAFGMARDQLRVELRKENVDTRAYYDPPVHRHKAYRKYAAQASLPFTDALAARSLSLPIWSDMEDRTARTICHIVQEIHGRVA